jgi:hypothetical protein
MCTVCVKIGTVAHLLVAPDRYYSRKLVTDPRDRHQNVPDPQHWIMLSKTSDPGSDETKNYGSSTILIVSLPVADPDSGSGAF